MMAQALEGGVDGGRLRIALVVSRFNEFVTQRLLEGAEACLDRHGCPADGRTVVRVPGSWELPQVVRRLTLRGEWDAIIALGALIRGETPHFEVLAHQVAASLARIGLDSGVPVIFGVLTTDTVEQAVARAGAATGNKGWEAALAALDMANLFRRLDAAPA
jgi:6,7-dimethyl-8-ribityllumazine synthase